MVALATVGDVDQPIAVQGLNAVSNGGGVGAVEEREGRGGEENVLCVWRGEERRGEKRRKQE